MLHPQIPEKGLIRFGPNGDGGYLIPDDLIGIEACFSPGVNDVSGFERDCAERNIKVFMADNSVDGTPEQHELFHFDKVYVGAYTGGDFITLDDWVNKSLKESSSDLILQMDIEGFEYETILNISTNLMSRFRIIVIEFHLLNQLWNGQFYKFASRAFEKLCQTHTCVHIHPNNCANFFNKEGLSIPPALEFTFYRSDKIDGQPYAQSFPHPLDFDCTSRKHLSLPDCLYRKNK